ncbi:hypothetical protein ACHAXR_011193 [Thalassiosira sp. AJA248-18]
MGKQSKRKNKRRNNAGKHHHNPTGLAQDDAAATASAGGSTALLSGASSAPTDNSPVDNIIKKVRHGDPRVRHAALVALAGTLYDSAALTSAASKKKKSMSGNAKNAAASSSSSAAAEANNPTLLRALSEKILDGDAPCAITAVGCLSNYVTFYCSSDGNGDGGDDDDEMEITSDVMVPILLKRVETSLGAITALGNQIMASAAAAAAKAGVAGATAGASNTTATSKKPTNKKKDDNNKSPIEKLWPSFTEQWSLLSLTLLTLAGLIENCPRAFQRMGGGATVFGQLLGVLPLAGKSMEYCNSNMQQQQQTTPKKDGDEKGGGEVILDAATNASRALHSLLDDNTELISSLGGGGSSATLLSATSELTAIIQNVKFCNMTRLHACGAILSLRRVLVLEKELAVSGGCISQEDGLVGQALQSCTNDVIVPMLHSLFYQFNDIDSSTSSKDVVDGSNPMQLSSQMIILSQKLTTLKQDEEMESSVVKDVNSRKEPARLIARRLKQQKEEKKKKKKDSSSTMGMEEDGKDNTSAKKEAEGDVAMIVEEEDDNASKTAEQQEEKEEKEGDLQQELDNVVQSWRDLVGSHKLALELVANLCSGIDDSADGIEEEDGMDDDDEHMWDSDDEAKLVASAQASAAAAAGGGGATTVTPCEQATYNAMSNPQLQLPTQVLLFFQKWMSFLSSSSSSSSSTMGSNDNGDKDGAVVAIEPLQPQPLPTLVLEDVDELLSTCALCLGNVVACTTLPVWSSPIPPGQQQQTKFLSQGVVGKCLVTNGVELFWWECVSILSYHQRNESSSTIKSLMLPLHHVTSVMLSLLQNQPKSRMLVDSPTLDRLFDLLNNNSSSNNSDDDGVTNLQTMQCHIISMMGLLCSEAHPAEIDARVCSALLERLRSVVASDDNGGNTNISSTLLLRYSIIITHEIFNVLMDIYGSDDCHENVFEKYNVLDHFQRCLPGFKRRIKKMTFSSGGRMSSEEEEKVNVWNETALNASRFIKYKKGA